MWKATTCILHRGLVPKIRRKFASECPFQTNFTNKTISRRNMSTKTVTVDVEQGTLRGKQVSTKTGFTYYSFQGIPYAQPPLGQLRFKAPQAPEPWTGIRDALKEGPICAQKDPIFVVHLGEEDCLFLNVYSSKLSGGHLLPVMVWIHGGGFANGSGDASFYGPDYLIEEDVIIVTLNYRLGPLGFLCLDNAEVPGNAGLKDQVMALKWIKKNIMKFGGDPNNVTLFGESAGGASVHYHMLSPMSKGLFNRGIIQSGSAINWWALTLSGRARAFRLGHALGCNTKDPQELLTFLRGVPVSVLIQAILKSVTKQERKQSILFPFVPTVEKEAENEETFLPALPHVLLAQGKFQHLPLIIGMNSREGLVMLRDFNEAIQKKMNADPQHLIPVDLNIPLETEISQRIGQKIKDFYFGGKSICEDTLEQYADLQSDTWFVYHIDQAVKYHASVSPAPIFQYKFTFDGELGLFKRLLGLQKYKGVCHADDIGYLFRPHIVDYNLDPQSSAVKCLRRVVKMWTNFAKTGNPTPEINPFLDVIWTPLSKQNAQYLNIGSQLKMEENVEDDRMHFWSDLYKTPNLSHSKL